MERPWICPWNGTESVGDGEHCYSSSTISESLGVGWQYWGLKYFRDGRRKQRSRRCCSPPRRVAICGHDKVSRPSWRAEGWGRSHVVRGVACRCAAGWRGDRDPWEAGARGPGRRCTSSWSRNDPTPLTPRDTACGPSSHGMRRPSTARPLRTIATRRPCPIPLKHQ